MSAPALEARGLRLTYPGAPRPALDGVDLVVAPGTLTALVGCNGSGKSTLLACAARQAAPEAGAVSVAGAAAPSRPALARLLAYLPARPLVPPDSTAREVVLMARHPFGRGLLLERAHDLARADAALARAGALEHRDRPCDALSSGERQRVLLARALCQDTPLVLLDEPTSAQDPAQALRVFDLLRALAREGRAVVVATHDLNLAARFADRLVALEAGRVVCDAPPAAALTPDLLRRVFGVEALFGRDGPVPYAVARAPADAAPSAGTPAAPPGTGDLGGRSATSAAAPGGTREAEPPPAAQTSITAPATVSPALEPSGQASPGEAAARGAGVERASGPASAPGDPPPPRAGAAPEAPGRLRPLVAIAACALVFALALALAPRVSSTGLLRAQVDLHEPRAAFGALAGAGLALAGVVLQAVLRNPLASPYTLGISSGAAVGAAASIQGGLLAGALGLPGTFAGALLGAAAAAALVYAVAARRELAAETLLLAGVAVALFAGAALAVLHYLADTIDLMRMIRWSMGSLDTVGWARVRLAAPFVLAGCGLGVLVARQLDVASLDDPSARALGVEPVHVRRLAFLGASVATAGVVAVAGPIGFVGLVVPNAVRALLGPDPRALLPCAALVGGALLVACDVLARTLTYPTELPINVITHAFGCPAFVWILLRRR